MRDPTTSLEEVSCDATRGSARKPVAKGCKKPLGTEKGLPADGQQGTGDLSPPAARKWTLSIS